MPNFMDGSYSTDASRALIAKVLAGKCSMHYTRVGVGKGTIPEGSSPKTMTEPAGYVMDAMIASVTTPVNGECQVTVQLNSSQVQEGFFATGLVLYAQDPDEGEVPYTYLVLENEPEWIRPSSSIVGKLATFDLVAAVDAVDTVTAVIDPESMVTAKAVEQMINTHNDDENAHAGILEKINKGFKVNGIIKGDGSGSLNAAEAGVDYQSPTNKLKASDEMTLEDSFPFYSTSGKEHRQVTLKDLKAAMGVQSPSINLTTCEGAAVTCVCGEKTLNSTGSSVISLPNIGSWKVTASLKGVEASRQVEVTGAMQYNVDLMLTSDIAITKPPTNKSYYVGEAFNSAGMVVTATFADETTEDVTQSCKFTPAVIAADTTEITVTYERAGITKTLTQEVTVRKLSSIAVTSQPSKVQYNHGDQFNSDGMQITATYDDRSSRVVTGWTYSPTGALTTSVKQITITYSEGGKTCTCTQDITVSKVLSNISVATQPKKTNYFSGEIFSKDGMTIRATYTDGTSAIVDGWTYSPTGALTQGTNAITISYMEGVITKTCTQAITVTTVSNTLNSNSWATIKTVSDNGNGKNYWSVGDTKKLTINGKVGNFTFSSLSVDAFIIGFNHNATREGDKRIHFQIGKINGTLVGLCDDQYGNEQTSAGYFNMNTSRTNSKGWSGSNMRNNILGNSGTPTSPTANTLMAALPTELRSVMKPVTKYTDNTGGGTNTASNVTGSTDYLFLLAEFEVFGTRYYANSGEQTYQVQYEYYQSGNSKEAKKHSATSTAVWWWLRSPYYSYSNFFCFVSTDGYYSYYSASWLAALLPGFAV